MTRLSLGHGQFRVGQLRSGALLALLLLLQAQLNCLHAQTGGASEGGVGRAAKVTRISNVTAKAPCDPSLMAHIYHPARLVVKQTCISVTGTLVDASHGRQKDGCRHEADGDGHCFLQLDKGEESLLNAKNRSNEGGNLVIEPICRYRVTQADAIEACNGWKQPLVLPPPGTHVRVTGAYVLDTQHGHMELHPVSSIEVLPPQ